MTKHHQILEFLGNWQEEKAKSKLPSFTSFVRTRDVYQEFLEELVDKFSVLDPSLLRVKASACQLETDLTQEVAFDAFLSPEGAKSKKSGFYLSLRPGQSFIGIGYLANTFVNGFALHEEQRLHGEELEYMLYFLTKYCGFDVLTGAVPCDTPAISHRINLGLEKQPPQPRFLFKSIPHEELMDSQLGNWLVQQYGLLLSYNQYLNRALDFFAHTSIDELEDYVDLP